MHREPPPPNRRPLAQGLGHPNDLPTRLPPQAVTSFAGVDYHLSLARLLQGERVVELGCGSGMDVLADATQVGPAGAVTACRHHNQSSSPKQSACAARAVQTNPAYRFASERAQLTSRKYAAHSVSLLVRKPASGSRPTNPTTTEEISK